MLKTLQTLKENGNLNVDEHIFQALINSDLEGLKFLIDEGFDPYDERYDHNLFKCVVKSNDLKILTFLHETYRIKDYEICELTFLAGNSGNIEMVKYLISIGGNPVTALHGACEYNYRDIIDYIFDNYDTIFGNDDLKDCFDTICANNNLDLVNYFLNKNIYYKSGAEIATYNNNLDILKLFTCYDLSEKHFFGDTLLMLSTLNKNLDCFNYLIEFCDPNVQNDRGNTALNYLLENNREPNIDILKKLLEISDPNLENNYGRTPFFTSLMEGDFLSVKILMSHPKVNIFTFDNIGNNALQFYVLNCFNFNDKIFTDIFERFNDCCEKEELLNHRNFDGYNVLDIAISNPFLPPHYIGKLFVLEITSLEIKLIFEKNEEYIFELLVEYLKINTVLLKDCENLLLEKFNIISPANLEIFLEIYDIFKTDEFGNNFLMKLFQGNYEYSEYNLQICLSKYKLEDYKIRNNEDLTLLDIIGKSNKPTSNIYSKILYKTQ